mmetsp:Transcript_93609/g.292786  ORF Transcript_93609/g.292786 Transcript_93609/m.292786 type:complete len:445 (+) Transcript_93609:887-2221(+)
MAQGDEPDLPQGSVERHLRRGCPLRQHLRLRRLLQRGHQRAGLRHRRAHRAVEPRRRLRPRPRGLAARQGLLQARRLHGGHRALRQQVFQPLPQRVPRPGPAPAAAHGARLQRPGVHGPEEEAADERGGGHLRGLRRRRVGLPHGQAGLRRRDRRPLHVLRPLLLLPWHEGPGHHPDHRGRLRALRHVHRGGVRAEEGPGRLQRLRGGRGRAHPPGPDVVAEPLHAGLVLRDGPLPELQRLRRRLHPRRRLRRRRPQGRHLDRGRQGRPERQGRVHRDHPRRDDEHQRQDRHAVHAPRARRAGVRRPGHPQRRHLPHGHGLRRGPHEWQVPGRGHRDELALARPPQRRRQGAPLLHRGEALRRQRGGDQRHHRPASRRLLRAVRPHDAHPAPAAEQPALGPLRAAHDARQRERRVPLQERLLGRAGQGLRWHERLHHRVGHHQQ